MFNRKTKIANCWSVTANPMKFDGEVMLSLGSYKKEDVLKGIIKDDVTIRLDKDEAIKLCKAIMTPFGE